jgi:hypothetical protein
VFPAFFEKSMRGLDQGRRRAERRRVCEATNRNLEVEQSFDARID